MAAIWQTQDRFGRQITLTVQRRDHILDEHSDLADRLHEVRTTVEQPEFVTRDRRFTHREICYRREPSRAGWIKVVVHYRPVPSQGTWAGEIITAYHDDERDAKEVPLWP